LPSRGTILSATSSPVRSSRASQTDRSRRGREAGGAGSGRGRGRESEGRTRCSTRFIATSPR
jgi:hypothetical protein